MGECVGGCVGGRPADHLPPRAVRYMPKCMCYSSGVQKKRANRNGLDPWLAPRNKTKRHEGKGDPWPEIVMASQRRCREL